MGFASNITKENRIGNVSVSIQVQGMLVTDEELAEMKRLEKELAVKIDEVLKPTEPFFQEHQR